MSYPHSKLWQFYKNDILVQRLEKVHFNPQPSLTSLICTAAVESVMAAAVGTESIIRVGKFPSPEERIKVQDNLFKETKYAVHAEPADCVDGSSNGSAAFRRDGFS